VDLAEQIVIVDLVSGSVLLQHSCEFLPEELPEELLVETFDAMSEANAK
jgi:hypothetical protein